MSIITRERVTKLLAATSLASLIFLSTLALHDEYVAIPHLTKTCIQTITTMKQKLLGNMSILAMNSVEQSLQVSSLTEQNAKQEKEIAKLKNQLALQRRFNNELTSVSELREEDNAHAINVLKDIDYRLDTALRACQQSEPK